MKSLFLGLSFAWLVLVAERGFESAPPIWKRHTIDGVDRALGKIGADGVRLADVNRDELLDVVTGWENGNAIRVCLNPGPAKVEQPWPSITVGNVKDAEDAVFADLDGDLRIDVISACEGGTQSLFVHWAPPKGEDYRDEDAWTTKVIPCSKKKSHWMFLLPFDVDRDGDTDLIAGSKGKNGAVGYLVNPGHERARDLSKWTWEKLASAGWIMSLRDIDLDGDGHREIIYSDRKGKDSGVYVMNHLTEAPWLSKPIKLGFAGREVMFIDIKDLNGDQKLDIAAAIRPQDFGYLYQPAEKPWRTGWEEKLNQPLEKSDRFGASKAIRVVDLNGDDQLEVVATCGLAKGNKSGVLYFPYLPAVTNDVTKCHPIDLSGPEGVKYDRMEIFDIDQDGDLDIMTCEEVTGLGVVWYENPD